MVFDLDTARYRLRHAYLRDEADAVAALLAAAPLDHAARGMVSESAHAIVEQGRNSPSDSSALDAFLHEFDLANQEGVALMCLAEALLRIPDTATQDELISGILRSADWASHRGHSASLFVNASVWALMLTGSVLELGERRDDHLSDRLSRAVARLGEPAIRHAVKQAVRIMSGQFVYGRTIAEALTRMNAQPPEQRLCSFDMLGEGARTSKDAQRYFERYRAAIAGVGQAGGAQSVSIKLSALHPRYEDVQHLRVMGELLPRLKLLAQDAMISGLQLTIDAEEADRLDLSLSLFEALAADTDLRAWNGLGLAVQAYQKRSAHVIDWLIGLAAQTGRRFPVRLVKGAYWDTEIKRAQELGLADYPVYTQKSSTDVSYLVCAHKMLTARDAFTCQFATHNAHTIAAITHMAAAAGDVPFEFQRLHGMGEDVYAAAAKVLGARPKIRVYAPVGAHEDLLPYLVRRLLENGANTSFINRFHDAQAPAREIAADPLAVVEALTDPRHPRIPLPRELYGAARRNSQGINLADPLARHALLSEIHAAAKTPVSAPREALEHDIENAVREARSAQPAWDRLGGPARAEILRALADLIESQRALLMHLLMREAGKTVADAQSEVREAADFCRYYAQQADIHFTAPMLLAGPVGERNELSLHGRGIFACISPWNFPLAIFTGQIAAALAAGNAVIAKPAEQTPIIAACALRMFHQAGVPEAALHLLTGPGKTLGAALTADDRIDGVVFTGSIDTAKSIARTLASRAGPIVPLIAETGGVNAMIVDSSALGEQVADDVMISAFGSAGQRCSALRLLFIQDNVADRIIELLAGAIRERGLGDPADPATDIGPVIDARAHAALSAHVARMQREAKLVAAGAVSTDLQQAHFFAPHIFELHDAKQLSGEVFGPILHVVRFAADDLEQVIERIREMRFGLTFGLHSRIEERWDRLSAEGLAGNMYVNRSMTGAVVGVQPFGGHGLSGTGPKAGGPYYLPRFATERVISINIAAVGGNPELFRL